MQKKHLAKFNQSRKKFSVNFLNLMKDLGLKHTADIIHKAETECLPPNQEQSHFNKQFLV